MSTLKVAQLFMKSKLNIEITLCSNKAQLVTSITMRFDANNFA